MYISGITDQQSQDQAMIPFTGYYTLDAATGAFVMVDSNKRWAVNPAGGDPIVEYTAVVTISPDGQVSNKYPLGVNCAFIDNVLSITDANGDIEATLTFSPPTATEGCAVQGTIGTTTVSGTTPFAPIELSIWSGTYYAQGKQQQQGGLLIYPYTATLEIGTDGTVQFVDAAGNLSPVPTYSYDYAMFVVAVTLDPANPVTSTHLYEMGTASGWGRVAGNARNGSMLVSIQQQEPIPNL